jgi:hypothetical protein
MQPEFVNQFLFVFCVKNHFSGLLLGKLSFIFFFGFAFLIRKNTGV